MLCDQSSSLCTVSHLGTTIFFFMLMHLLFFAIPPTARRKLKCNLFFGILDHHWEVAFFSAAEAERGFSIPHGNPSLFVLAALAAV